MKYLAYSCLLVLLLSYCATKQEITTGSLLLEMIDRENIAEFPNPSFTLKQFSSYDRKSINPDQPGWFANADRSQFIRKEINQGRREFVLFDAAGPGAIVRFWVTVAMYEGNGMLRIYIDNNPEPELEGEVLKMMSGGAILEGPLAGSVSDLTEYIQRGHNLYLPIPYSKHCKITYESAGVDEIPGAISGEAFYYNINYRTYAPNIKVSSFSLDDLETYKSEIDLVQQTIANVEKSVTLKTPKLEETNLSAGQSAQLEISGTNAIHQITMKIIAENQEQAMRSTVLEMEFDGNKTVWCPVGDFYGTGYKISPYSTWYTKVEDNGTMVCRWVMPFKDQATLRIVNHGEQDISIEQFDVAYADYSWTENSMHFGAGWHELNRVSSKKPGRNMDEEGAGCFDINYVELSGKGVLVGNGVALFNTTDAWWGEGDEKIFVDHEKFPSHFGTGSEDFYGYAWSNPNKFDHPFIAQPDGTGAMESGYVVNLRYRALDVIPFTSHLKFDMEMWHQSNTVVNYAPVSYWYMLPGGKSNLAPVAQQVQQAVALSRLDFYLEGYAERNIFIDETKVSIDGRENGFEIRFTQDGTDPTKNSKLYNGPFKLNQSATIKSIGFSPKGYSTEILEGRFINQEPIEDTKINEIKKGLKYQYFELEDVLISTKQLAGLGVDKEGIVQSLSFPDFVLPLKFGLIYSGYVYVDKPGVYRFTTITNDGSMLYIHDQLVVSNDGPHGARERSGEIALAPGYHPIKMEYIQIGGSRHLEVFMEGPGVERQKIASTNIVH